MSNKESTLVNMVLTLLLVTLVASTSLGLVYKVTKDPIDAAKLAKRIAAIEEVVPKFNNSPLQEVKIKYTDKDSIIVYPAKNNNELTGIAVETFTNSGFSGYIKLIVGFLPNGTIKNITVLEHKETPGLGDKIEKEKSDFILQFQGKNPKNYKLKVKKDDGDVDAITAATISSRAFCDALQTAYDTYKSINFKIDSISTKQ